MGFVLLVVLIAPLPLMLAIAARGLLKRWWVELGLVEAALSRASSRCSLCRRTAQPSIRTLLPREHHELNWFLRDRRRSVVGYLISGGSVDAEFYCER